MLAVLPRIVIPDVFADQTLPKFEVGEFVATKDDVSLFAQIEDRIWTDSGWRYGIHYVGQSSTLTEWCGGGYCYRSNEPELTKICNPLLKMQAAIWNATDRITVRELQNQRDAELIRQLQVATKVAKGEA